MILLKIGDESIDAAVVAIRNELKMKINREQIKSKQRLIGDLKRYIIFLN